MLAYTPGETIVHRLDPRTKLFVQLGFTVSIILTTDPVRIAILTLVTLTTTAVASVSISRVVWELRYVLPVLLVPVLFEGMVLGAPWFSASSVRDPLIASYRVLLLLIVSAVYVRTTPVRASRAAIHWAIPGKPGQFFGMGVSFVFRFVPLLQSDLARTRAAMHTRIGTERPLTDRIRLITIAGLARAFARADRFSDSLKARCFAWNPTLPPLHFRVVDVGGFVLGLLLLVFPLV